MNVGPWTLCMISSVMAGLTGCLTLSMTSIVKAWTLKLIFHCQPNVLLGRWIRSLNGVENHALFDVITVLSTSATSLLCGQRIKALSWYLFSLEIRNRMPTRSEEHTSELQSRPHLV